MGEHYQPLVLSWPTATFTVIAIGGDGDGYAEGGNHFLHAVRKNINITYLVHDNRVFGLTKGRRLPFPTWVWLRTTPKGG